MIKRLDSVELEQMRDREAEFKQVLDEINNKHFETTEEFLNEISASVEGKDFEFSPEVKAMMRDLDEEFNVNSNDIE
eukprot:CAMPEP_0117429722 /NCGR_PEP_ID=MMETSP0758-20121206/9239_1 /TAXON_ID=63605 /ORGANISM="Percolomonas cosmopolitus, Strain AE-1 (ATCC 50343)" /LENGTH=76 /DNA_ID=CAMNT_0005216981 /DNA_START=399 /DNA_END=626 /DNA_ORIENTATION=-